MKSKKQTTTSKLRKANEDLKRANEKIAQLEAEINRLKEVAVKIPTIQSPRRPYSPYYSYDHRGKRIGGGTTPNAVYDEFGYGV